jgi:hypothetical protein
MADNHLSEQPVDPELNRRLTRLRAVPPRDPHVAARAKANFIAEVDEIVKEQGFSDNSRIAGTTTFNQRWKEKWIMATPRFRTVFTLAAAFVTLVVFMFGGAGMTAYASQSALPGDALYGVKTSVEQTRVSLARDAADRAQLNLAFAERRLDEIARLIAGGRYADIATAVQEYEKYVQSAIAALETVAAGDPTGAQELASQVAGLLKRYAETLGGMVNALPDAARNEVERAIQVSNTASGFTDEIEFVGTVEAINADSWMVSGRTFGLIPASEIKGLIMVGSLVKVHALQDANGNLTLREVELADGDDANVNDDDGINDNDDDMNDNDDDGINDNDDDLNDNDDDGINDNDDDLNDNDDNDINDNDDGINDNDDDLNDNDDDGDDLNDNDDDGDDSLNDNDDDGDDNLNDNDNDDDDNDDGDDDLNDNDDDDNDANDNDDDDGDDD